MNVSYAVNKQLREAWAQIACMVLVPAGKGIGTLTNRAERCGTILWAEPAQLILDVRWAEFARANFM